MKSILLPAALMFLPIANDASAAGKWVSADELLSSCKEAIVMLDGGKGPVEKHLHTGTCVGFLQGVLGLIQETVLIGENAKSQICVPSDISVRQLVRVVISFAEKNPDLLHQNAAGLVLLAYFKAFPC